MGDLLAEALREAYADRDRAREVAVLLEQECARLAERNAYLEGVLDIEGMPEGEETR